MQIFAQKTSRMDMMMILSLKSDFVWYGHQNLDGKLMKSLKSLWSMKHTWLVRTNIDDQSKIT